MKHVKCTLALASLLMLTACDPDEIVTGLPSGQHEPTTEKLTFTGTLWQDYVEIQDLAYIDGTIQADVTNLVYHPLSAMITIRWQIGLKSGRNVVFMRLDSQETKRLECVDYSLDNDGDTHRSLRVERVEIGDWESYDQYYELEPERSTFLQKMGNLKNDILDRLH